MWKHSVTQLTRNRNTRLNQTIVLPMFPDCTKWLANNRLQQSVEPLNALRALYFIRLQLNLALGR